MASRAEGKEGTQGPADDTETLAESLRVLANPGRLRLLRFLVEPRTVGAIAKELGVARQNAEMHLRQLTALGVVQRAELPGTAPRPVRFVVAPHRLFDLQEQFSKLGAVEPEPGLVAGPRTRPLATGAAGPSDKDLPRLTIVRGMRVGHTALVSGEGPWLLGRERDAAVCLDYDSFVSARHAEVRRTAGGFEVADLFSSNGTFVEWDRLPRGGSRPIDNGHVIRVGKSILLFRKP